MTTAKLSGSQMKDCIMQILISACHGCSAEEVRRQMPGEYSYPTIYQALRRLEKAKKVESSPSTERPVLWTIVDTPQPQEVKSPEGFTRTPKLVTLTWRCKECGSRVEKAKTYAAMDGFILGTDTVTIVPQGEDPDVFSRQIMHCCIGDLAAGSNMELHGVCYFTSYRVEEPR